MNKKDYLLLTITFIAIATVSVFATVKIINENKIVFPEVVKVSEVKQLPSRSRSNNVCSVLIFDAAADCAVGSKIVFTPLRSGNEQLPIYFAGQYCDLNYAVVSNNGGVTCIKAAPYEDPVTEANKQDKCENNNIEENSSQDNNQNSN